MAKQVLVIKLIPRPRKDGSVHWEIVSGTPRSAQEQRATPTGDAAVTCVWQLAQAAIRGFEARHKAAEMDKAMRPALDAAGVDTFLGLP